MRCLKLVTIMFVSITALCACQRFALDRQMAELCKKDGGVKVYETVKLSPAGYDELSKYATVKNRENYYGPEYRYVERREILVGKNADPEKGQVARGYQAIYRKSDGRLLGENISYSRVGGDGFTFGLQPSGNHCPTPRVSLKRAVFLKGE